MRTGASSSQSCSSENECVEKSRRFPSGWTEHVYEYLGENRGDAPQARPGGSAEDTTYIGAAYWGP